MAKIPTEKEVKDILLEQLNSGQITREEAERKMSNYRKMQAGEPLTPKPQQAQPQEDPPGFRERLAGNLQAVTKITAGAVLEPFAGLGGLVVGGITGSAEQAAGAVESVRGLSEVIPTNRAAQEWLAGLGNLVEKGVAVANYPLSGWAGIGTLMTGGSMEQAAQKVSSVQEDGISDVLGETVLNVTGSPEMAAIAYSLPTAALEAMGIRGARALKGQSVLNAESKFLASNPKVAMQQAAPSIAELKKNASALYKEIDDAKVLVDQDGYLNMAIEIADEAAKLGFDPRVSQQLTPKSQSLLRLIEDDLGANLTFTNLDQTRRLARIAAQSIDNKVEAAIGTMVINKIDDFLDTEADRLARDGDAVLSGKYKEARNLWSRAIKAETLDDLVTNAKEAASGFENGLRIGFRQLLKNKKRLRGFSDAEIAIMREISQGTTMANTFKKLGKLGFGDNQQTSMLLFSLGAGGGYAAAGPLGAVVIPSVGTVSGKLATSLTKDKSKLLNDVVRAGGDGLEIARSYIKHTPKSERSIAHLTELLMGKNVDLGTIDATVLDEFILDAKFAAERFIDIGAANLMEVPALLESMERSNPDNTNSESDSPGGAN